MEEEQTNISCQRLPNWPWFGGLFSHLGTEIDVARVQASWKHLVDFITMEYFLPLSVSLCLLKTGSKTKCPQKCWRKPQSIRTGG